MSSQIVIEECFVDNTADMLATVAVLEFPNNLLNPEGPVLEAAMGKRMNQEHALQAAQS